MTLLIDGNAPAWVADADLRDAVAPLLPGVEILTGPPERPLPGVTMLATTRLGPGRIARLPDLRLIQKLGAGVESMLSDPDLPAHVRVTRMSSAIQGIEIAEYCLAHVLARQRHVLTHARDQKAENWQPRRPLRTDESTVAVLGLGHIGGAIAGLFARTGYRTLGWSRRPKVLEGIETRAGPATLDSVLAEADHVVAILPSTPETRDLFDARRLAAMKPGATLINCGRGDLIVEADLSAALATGTPGHAVLDVFREEPLPAGHPFWRDERITITPHISGWHVDGMAETLARNYRGLTDGTGLVNEVDRGAGY